jgi:hypothetical protein
LLVDVLEEGLHEGSSHFFYALFEPHIVMKEISLASQDAQIDCKVVVLAVDDLDETVFDFLCDV